LIHLQKRTDIIIRPADKNVGIVILESNVYESKVLQQLQDTEFYNKLNYIPSTQIFKRIKFELNQLFNNKQISFYILKLLLPMKPTCATFYILPKLHKIKCPGRPIVSGIQHVTSNISKYLERHLTPFISHLHQIAIDEYQIDNYIVLKDTNHLLIEIENINKELNVKNLNIKNLTLITGDITSLYTNIDQDDGISTLMKFISSYTHITNFPLSLNAFGKLLDLVLKNNVFMFKGQYYHQVKGTAMGTALAPPYANIYVFCKEIVALKQFIKKYSSRLLLRFFRFLDDIFILLLSNDILIINELQHLLNSTNPNLKYTFEISKSNIHYLDVNIIKNSTLNRLETSLYVKPSNTFQYLQFSSSHPRHIINNIPLSLSNRIIRICSSTTSKWYEFFNLFTRLLSRGHNATNILRKILELENSDRHELIQRPKKTNKKDIHQNVIIPFHSQLPNIRLIFQNEFSMNIPENIRFIYKCDPNLHNLLIRSRYPHSFYDIVPEPDTNPLGSYRCQNPRCITCKHIIEQDWFMSTVTNQIFIIPYSANCGTSNLVYLITCTLCHSQYVGTTSQTLRNRLNHHLTAIKNKYWHDTTCPEHFNSAQHSIEHLKIIIIEKNYINEQHRLDREHFWIKTLRAQLNATT
ncbi:unnamed protein product, partial [Rotaria sp. Silwood1]